MSSTSFPGPGIHKGDFLWSLKLTQRQMRHLGGGAGGAVAPQEKKEKKKENKKKGDKREKKRKRKKGIMNDVKLLHIKCCFFPIFQ